MKTKFHIFIEIALVAVLAVVVVRHQHNAFEAEFPLKDGGLLTVQSFDKSGVNPDIAIYLNKGTAPLLPLITITPYGDTCAIKITNKDGFSVNTEYKKDGTGPSFVGRSVEFEGKHYYVVYNDVGDVAKKIEMNQNESTRQPQPGK